MTSSDKLREKLVADEAAVNRWWKRLRRAVTALEKLRKRIHRTEKQIRQAKES